MKRILVILLGAALLFNLVGCTAEKEEPEPAYYSFSWNGVRIVMGAEAAPVLEALGEPKSHTEEPSCAFDGMDETYYYGSFYLSTCTLDGREYIYTLWFADDSVETEEHIRIGSSQSQVEAAYGEDCFSGTNSLVLTRGESRLIVLLEDGLVSSVRYEAVL